MNEYIKREDVLKAIKALPNVCGCSAIDSTDAEDAVVSCPAADVAPRSEDTVEVIRCRNCKHWDRDEIRKYTYSSNDSTMVDFAECTYWSCWSTCHSTRYDDYCSLAEEYTEGK